MKRITAALVCLFVLATYGLEAQKESTTVLVTGANRGLGFEFAKQYAERGWDVIATVRDPNSAQDLQRVARETKRITIEKLDLLDRSAIAALATKYKGRPIDVLINNAGVLGDLQRQKLGSFDYAEFEQVMAVNVYGGLAMAEAFRDHVAASQQKKIVSITSGSGIISAPNANTPGYGPYFYRASKVATNMVSRMLQYDLRDRGVIVAMISPGTADTDMRRALVGSERASRDQPPAAAVATIMKTIDGLTFENSQTPLNPDGKPLPW